MVQVRVNIVQRRVNIVQRRSWVIDDSVGGIATHRDVSWGLPPAFFFTEFWSKSNFVINHCQILPSMYFLLNFD